MNNDQGQGTRLESLVRSCRMILKLARRPGGRRSDLLYYQMLAGYYDRLLKAKAEGKPVVAHTVFMPAEILYAMDIVPMHTEMTTWTMALMLGQQAGILAAGAELGLAPEICSAHRGLAGVFSLGALPRPDAIIWSNKVCDNTAKSGELLMELTGRPGFFLDHPFQRTPGEMAYLVGQLREMVEFLEQVSGRKMSWERLAEAVARMDRQMELYREISELRRAVPSPLHLQGFFSVLMMDYLYPGQPEATEYLEAVRSELAEMVRQGKGAVEQERFRLMTLFIPPMYRMGALERMMQGRGAVSVIEPFFSLWPEGKLDASAPLESIAVKSFMMPAMRMYGPLDERTVQDVSRAVKDYRVDGAIYYASAGCRQSCAVIKLFKDVLGRVDVPMLTLDCDVVDPTVVSEEETRDRLERFFELLEDR